MSSLLRPAAAWDGVVKAVASVSVAATAALLALSSPPARALETVELRLPLIETSFTVHLDELTDSAALFRGSSDLAEFNRATNGAIGRRLLEVMATPVVSAEARAGLSLAAGTPLLQQALLAASTLLAVDDLPADPDGSGLTTALRSIPAEGPVSLLTLMRALPGTTASLDLGEALQNLRRLRRQQQQADALLARLPAAGVDPSLAAPGSFSVNRRSITIPVDHRREPLELLTLRPESGGNGRLVVISHGLWDSPESFEGWGRHLAGHGYAVVLPRHPGSDQTHQQAMLSGEEPPPRPEELRLRPLDVIASLDAVESGRLEVLAGVSTRHAVVVGHSWGGTTALQLAGLRSSSRELHERCSDLDDHDRNISWVLQCSFLSSADEASLAEPRVIAAVAVSPPLSLLFDEGAARGMNGRVLLVSGSRDWVVPSDPEAIIPFEGPHRGEGHRLVLVDQGTHFNLRPAEQPEGGVLRGLILAWVEAAFSSGESARPAAGSPNLLPPDGWGSTTNGMVDATPSPAGN